MLRTGHGVWTHAGGRRFTNTVVLFRFNPDGSYAGTQTVRRQIAVSRDAHAFLARDTVTIANPDGTVVDTRCGIGRGRRLHPWARGDRALVGSRLDDSHCPSGVGRKARG